MDPLDEAKVPTSHDVQDELPEPEYVPTAQSVQADDVVAATVVLKVPAEQSVQMLEPEVEAYVPAVQSVQVLEPAFEAYLPAAQFEQMLEPSDDV